MTWNEFIASPQVGIATCVCAAVVVALVAARLWTTRE